MPPRKKTKRTHRTVSSASSSVSHPGLDIQVKVILFISMVVIFLIGLVMTDMMSKAMAAVIVNGYNRQISIGDVRFDSPDRVIATGVAEGVFEETAQPNVYDVRASLNIPVGNILTYQIFTATSSDPWALTDLDMYGCVQQLSAEELNRNTIFIGCTSTPDSPRIPGVGDLVLARYYYIPGPAIYNFPLCGNGVVEDGEFCDDAGQNGNYDHCNNTCDAYTVGSCPAGFWGPISVWTGSSWDNGCRSEWMETSELVCAVRCTDTIVSHSEYDCYVVATSDSSNLYGCFGPPLASPLDSNQGANSDSGNKKGVGQKLQQ